MVMVFRFKFFQNQIWARCNGEPGAAAHRKWSAKQYRLAILVRQLSSSGLFSGAAGSPLPAVVQKFDLTRRMIPGVPESRLCHFCGKKG